MKNYSDGVLDKTSMNSVNKVLIFALDDRKYALRLSSVKRIFGLLALHRYPRHPKLC